MKLRNFLLGTVLFVFASVANAVTVFIPTDGDINFSLTTGNLANYTLAIFDDDADLSNPLTTGLEVTVAELIFYDSVTQTLTGSNGSLDISLDGEFVLAVRADANDPWIGGEVNAPNAFAQLLLVPEVNQYTVTFGNIGGFQLATDLAPIPVPAAVWLFGSGLIGLVGVARRRA